MEHTINEIETEWRKVFGDSSRNKVLEFFIEAREMEHIPNDICKVLKISRANFYIIIKDLIKEDMIFVNRKVGNISLYKLNTKNWRVKELIKSFNSVLRNSYANSKQTSD